MTVIIGIDPGATGAIAVITLAGQLVAVTDTPYFDGRVSAPTLASLIAPHTGAVAVVEQAQAYPGQGVSSVFKYGVGYGVILGVLGTLHIPIHHVTPAVWKKAAGLSKDKGASRRRATELWPDRADLFARVKDDGRAEAALIGVHGLRHMGLEVPA